MLAPSEYETDEKGKASTIKGIIKNKTIKNEAIVRKGQ